MAIELYNKNGHICLMISHLGDEDGEAVQANQFLVVHDKTGALIDPGGNTSYNELLLTIGRYFPVQNLSSILASHSDPDIIASLDRWMTSTSAQLYISQLWVRFAPHFCKPGKTVGRIKAIPDAGMKIPLGNTHLVALPAHFMHSEGNFQFWDPISRILFSGDLGASMVSGADASVPVSSLKDHIPKMEAFHRRYMVSSRILSFWAEMARQLPIEMIVPQHGRPMKGAAVQEFIDWIDGFSCGVDHFTQDNYRIPA